MRKFLIALIAVPLALAFEVALILFCGEVVADIDLTLREALGIALYATVVVQGVSNITAQKVLD